MRFRRYFRREHGVYPTLNDYLMNGTFEDMISFFGISAREGRRWTKAGQSEIGFWRCGRKLIFGEEAIVEKRAKGYVAARRLAPGEARELARAEWRRHLEARRQDLAVGHDGLADLEKRVERIERALNLTTEAAA